MDTPPVLILPRHAKMAAYLSRLHHVSLHVSHVGSIASDLVSKLKFDLFAARLTDGARQFAFRKGAAVFVVNERPPFETGSPTLNGGDTCEGVRATYVSHLQNNNNNNNTTTNNNKDNAQGCLYDVDSPHSVDTACNVCFEVRDVERAFAALRDLGCVLLVPPTVVRDSGGAVTYTVVKSVVGNVCHTLVDRTGYEGSFLPGFRDVANLSSATEAADTSCPVTHFDHITYACEGKTTAQVMQWYEKCFGFQRFFLDR